MPNQPSTFRFTLRALFIVTAFVGLGLLALKYPNASRPWVNMSVVLLVAYASISALVRTGTRRLFWAAFAVTAATALLACQSHLLMGPITYLPSSWFSSLAQALHPPRGPGGLDTPATYSCTQITHLLSIIVLSTAAAYIIPWLVQRGQKPPRA